MPATLSPFRYIQLARYVIQWWVDAAPMFAARRKAAQERAAQFIYAPRLRARALAAPPVANAMVVNNIDDGDRAGAATPAGPHIMSFGGMNSNSNSSSGNPRSRSMHTDAAPSQSQYTPPVELDVLQGSKVPHNRNPNISDLPPQPDRRPDPQFPPESQQIYRLMNDPRAFVPGVMQAPKEVVVLCHGLYGFSTATPIPLFPSLKLHYWASVLEVLRDRMGANVVVVGVKGTGSIQERADQMHAFLKDYLPKGTGVNFVAHSMGGLDCRHLISSIKPKEYTPLSLTSIATPHRGSPFMDWCAANIGVGSHSMASKLAQKAAIAVEHLPFTLKSPVLDRESSLTPKKESDALSSFSAALTNYLLNIFDTPAYNNLTTSYLRDHFNPATPDDPNVKYFSVAGRVSKMSILHPLWFTKLVLDSAAEKGYPDGETAPGHSYEGNDGLVSVQSAKWGEFLGVVDGCHHWDLRGEGGLWPQGTTIGDKKESKDKAKVAASERENDSQYAMPGGWDWECGVGLDHDYAPQKRDKQLDPAQHARDLATARAMSPSEEKKASTFDLAAVGQIIDWVGDLFPGDKKPAEPTHQLADAKREMEAGKGTSANGNGNGNGNGKKTIVRDKFDLQRFYGGLMLRLREEGL